MHLYINSKDEEVPRSDVGIETADGFNWLWKRTPKKGSKNISSNKKDIWLHSGENTTCHTERNCC